jgi:hypothetical protein
LQQQRTGASDRNKRARLSPGTSQQKGAGVMENIVDRNSVNDEALFEESFQRVRAELESLPMDSLVSINLDVISSVATVLGSLPEIRALRVRIEREMPGFDFTQFDKLEDYAMALSYAHTQFLTASKPRGDLKALKDEAVALRETLLGDATTLGRRGVIDANQLKQLKGAVGYKKLAQDLQILSKILKEKWSEIRGKCAVQGDELVRAEKLAARILRLVGLRGQVPAALAAATELRLRAFTALVTSYDQARRAAIYLRWAEGDADTIAPSLYAGRRRRKPGVVAGADVAASADANASAPGTDLAVTVSSAALNPPTAAAANAVKPPVTEIGVTEPYLAEAPRLASDRRHDRAPTFPAYPAATSSRQVPLRSTIVRDPHVSPTGPAAVGGR